MRVLHLLSSTDYHGAENMAVTLVSGLEPLGVECYVGAVHRGPRSNIQVVGEAKKWCRGTFVISGRRAFDWRIIGAIRNILVGEKIDILHSHKYATDVLGALAARGLRTRKVATCHNWVSMNLRMKAYEYLDKFFLREFDAVVGVSSGIVHGLKKWVKEKRLHRIENGIDVEYFSGETGGGNRDESQNGDFVVGYVGRLSRLKGTHLLIKAIGSLQEEGRRIRGIIVGSGPAKDELLELARETCKPGSVEFVGHQKDTARYYRRMDLFVLPSYEEAFPLVVLEAMACGVPVLATDVGDVREMLDDARLGGIMERGSVEQIVSGIRQSLSNVKEIRDKAAKAFDYVRSNYTVSRMAQRYEEIYSSIL